MFKTIAAILLLFVFLEVQNAFAAEAGKCDQSKSYNKDCFDFDLPLIEPLGLTNTSGHSDHAKE